MKLNQKIILGVVGAILIFSTFFLVNYINNQRKTEIDRFKKNITRNNILIASTTLGLIWNYEGGQIQENLKFFFQDEEILKIVVYDDFDTILAKVEREKSQKIGKEVMYKLPLIKVNKLIGRAEVTYTTEKLEKNIIDMRNAFAVLVSGLVILIIAVIIIISKVILSPIKEIIKGLKKVDAGILDYKIFIKTRDEFKEIEIFFNKMVDSIFREITKRKEKEEELVKAAKEKSDILINMNAELEKKVVERTAELRKSMDDLTDAQAQLLESEKMASLGNLVAGVAHEVNTPLGVCLTAATFLNEKTKNFKNEYEKENISKEDLDDYVQTADESTDLIIRNIVRADELIHSFKQVAVDQSSEEKREFIVKEYMESILHSMNPKWKKTKHTVTFCCEEEIRIFSYPGAFYQIISNLISNSLLHGFEKIENGVMKIDCKRKDDNLVIVYEDNGKGMSGEILKKIYEPFYTTKRGSGGSGLGMHIVYNIVQRKLGGVITTKSEIGKGIYVEIVLPIDEKS